MRNWAIGLGLAACVAAQAFAQAPDPVLLAGEGVVVRESDIVSDAQRLPEEMRARFLSSTDNVAKMAKAIYVRRAMAERARKGGAQKNVATQAALNLATDKILSDAYLTAYDNEHVPDAVQVNAHVKSAYEANTDKYRAPEEVHVAHILIANDDDASAKAQIEQLLKDVQAGADFAALAAEKSSDPGSRSKGGDLGFVPRGRMLPEFEEAAFALQKPGQLSPVVKTKFGYHIIKLIERKPARLLSLQEVEPQLQLQYKKHIQQEARQKLQEQLLGASKADQSHIDAMSARFKAQ